MSECACPRKRPDGRLRVVATLWRRVAPCLVAHQVRDVFEGGEDSTSSSRVTIQLPHPQTQTLPHATLLSFAIIAFDFAAVINYPA